MVPEAKLSVISSTTHIPSKFQHKDIQNWEAISRVTEQTHGAWTPRTCWFYFSRNAGPRTGIHRRLFLGWGECRQFWWSQGKDLASVDLVPKMMGAFFPSWWWKGDTWLAACIQTSSRQCSLSKDPLSKGVGKWMKTNSFGGFSACCLSD